jgi:hypothetical protein
MNQTLTSELWKQELLNTAQRCPGCGVNWLIIGVEQLESYICRKCGENFAILIKASKAGARESDTGSHEQSSKIA